MRPDGQAAGTPYTIFALKYAGALTSCVAKVLFDTDWDTTIERNYYIWAVQGAGRTVVIDCGVHPTRAEQPNLRGYASRVEVDAVLGRWRPSRPPANPWFHKLGIDPIHFRLAMVLNLMIGQFTQPFGVVLYVVVCAGQSPSTSSSGPASRSTSPSGQPWP